MKIQNEEVMVKNTYKTLINELKDQCICKKLLKKRYLYYSKASNTENVEIFHGLQNKAALLMRKRSERVTKNCHQNYSEKVWIMHIISVYRKYGEWFPFYSLSDMKVI